MTQSAALPMMTPVSKRRSAFTSRASRRSASMGLIMSAVSRPCGAACRAMDLMESSSVSAVSQALAAKGLSLTRSAEEEEMILASYDPKPC